MPVCFAQDIGTEVAEMMKYFKTADPDDMSQGALSRRVRYLKREKGGYQLMCEAAEELINWGKEEGRVEGREETKREIACKLQKVGFNSHQIADTVNVDVGVIKEWLETAKQL